MKLYNHKSVMVCLILITSLFSSAYAQNATDTFKQAFNNHQQLINQGKYQEALPLAKQSYQIAKDNFAASSKNRLVATDNYALNLQVTENLAEAHQIFSELLALYEQNYGKHGAELLPILTDINALEQQLGVQIDQEQAKQNAIRKYKLYLRHNSDEFVEQFADQNLPTTQHAKNTLDKVNNKLGEKYSIYESEHWSIIYPTKKLKFVKKHLARVIETTYDNNLSFLVSLGLRNKPIDNKMTAVYFANKKDYTNYHKAITKDAYASKVGEASYQPKERAIFLYDRGNKNGKARHASPAMVVWATSVQVFHQTGLLPTTVIFPDWFRKGLANSFQAQTRKKPFGPHQQNYRHKDVFKIQKRYEDGTLAPLETLVSLDGDQEEYKKESRKYFFDISKQGAMLVRFLYLNYPDELKDYINIIKKSRKAKFERAKFGKSVRLKQFKKAFGEPQALQAQYNAFLEQTFADNKIAYAQYKKAKKNKKKAKKLSD